MLQNVRFFFVFMDEHHYTVEEILRTGPPLYALQRFHEDLWVQFYRLNITPLRFKRPCEAKLEQSAKSSCIVSSHKNVRALTRTRVIRRVSKSKLILRRQWWERVFIFLFLYARIYLVVYTCTEVCYNASNDSPKPLGNEIIRLNGLIGAWRIIITGVSRSTTRRIFPLTVKNWLHKYFFLDNITQITERKLLYVELLLLNE